MAKEAAEAFVKKYGSDEAFRKKVDGFDSPQAISTYLGQEGFAPFTRQELEDARKAAGTSGELSDTELEAVAGGAWVTWEIECDEVEAKWGSTAPDSCQNYSCTSVW